MVHSTSHLTPEMLESAFKQAFSGSVTHADKDAARRLRELLVGSGATYRSVLFDIVEGPARHHDRVGLAEIAFLVGMQAGYELGICYPPPHGGGGSP